MTIGINIRTLQYKILCTPSIYSGIMGVRILNNVRALVPINYLLYFEKQKEYKLSDKVKKRLAQLIIFITLWLPIVLYAYQFGFTLSSDHKVWAEFGSIMSGIYSPIIAFIALLILANQARIQLSMDKHQHDSAFIERNRNDLDFYISKLESYLDKSYDEKLTIKEYLILNFSNVSNAQLLEVKTKEKAQAFVFSHSQVFDIWSAIYPILIGLDSQKKYPYVHNFESSKLRISSCLYFGTCVAMDNLYRCVSNDMQKSKYYFKRME